MPMEELTNDYLTLMMSDTVAIGSMVGDAVVPPRVRAAMVAVYDTIFLSRLIGVCLQSSLILAEVLERIGCSVRVIDGLSLTGKEGFWHCWLDVDGTTVDIGNATMVAINLTVHDLSVSPADTLTEDINAPCRRLDMKSDKLVPGVLLNVKSLAAFRKHNSYDQYWKETKPDLTENTALWLSLMKARAILKKMSF